MTKDLASVPDKLTVIGFPAAFAVLWLQEVAEKRSVIFLFFCIYSAVYVLSPVRAIKSYEFLSSSVLAALCGFFCFMYVYIIKLLSNKTFLDLFHIESLLILSSLLLFIIISVIVITYPSINDRFSKKKIGNINFSELKKRRHRLTISFIITIMFILSLSIIDLSNALITIPMSLSFGFSLIVLSQFRSILCYLIKFRRRFNRFRYL